MIPLITSENAFRQNVRELVLGIDIFDLHFRVPVGSIK